MHPAWLAFFVPSQGGTIGEGATIVTEMDRNAASDGQKPNAWARMMRFYDDANLQRIASDETEDSACRVAAAREMERRQSAR